MSQQPADEFPLSFIARRNFFNFFGITCKILAITGSVLYWVKLKAFRLREDITIYRGTIKKETILNIKARQIIDFAAAYDVVDLRSNAKVGALKRKGLKSIFRDEWLIMDESDETIGSIKEDSLFLAMLRRVFASLIPQTYVFTVGGQRAGEARGTWNPFLVKYLVRFLPSASLDPRLAMASVVLLMAIEGKQRG